MLIVTAKAVATLATDARYGFHRDELYYVVAGRRLALGYVDFPPVTPVVARVAQAVFGMSLVGLRLPALAAGIGVVLLTSAMAKHLGGTPRAQWLAALTITAAGFFLGASGLFQTVSFDVLAWALALYAFVRLLTSGQRTWWLGIGAAVGAGMMTKFTMPALVAGIGAATVLTPLRRDLRTPWPWLGALVAVALALPNLAWQVAHGWPSIDFLRGQNARIRSANPTPKYLTDQLLLLGPFPLVVCGAGARRLWRDLRLRALVWTVAAVELAYLVTRGKGYYPMDVFPVLIAAGAVTVAGWPWTRFRTVVVGLIVSGLIELPFTLPVLPEHTMLQLRLDKVRDDFSAELGWHQVVATIAQAYATIPEPDRNGAAVLTQNYSQAAAIDLYGRSLGLPAAWSGHNTYWLWLPRHASLDVVLAVGFPAASLRQWFGQVTPLARIPESRRVDTEERGAPIALCRQPRLTASQLWSRIKLFS